MHELSHGSKSSKNGLDFIAVSIFTLCGVFYMFHLDIAAISTWIVGMWIAFYNHLKNPKIEPKLNNERQMKQIPTYNLSQAQLICMLRNAQVEKRGK